jgi:hypothetical protein
VNFAVTCIVIEISMLFDSANVGLMTADELLERHGAALNYMLDKVGSLLGLEK